MGQHSLKSSVPKSSCIDSNGRYPPFLAQGVARQTSAIVAFLQESTQLPPKQLLAPNLTPYIQTPPAQFKALTVPDVIQQVFGRKLAQNERVLSAAETLHRSLTGDIYLGKQYFREKWFNVLGAGPAFLISYLRSFCYFNEESGELRNEIQINRTELAGALGIERTTLHRWMKKLIQETDDIIFGKWDNDRASQTFATAVTQNELSHLFDLLGVDRGGPSRQRISDSGLTIEEITAWHLYALQQTGLAKSPVTLTIKRAQTALPPPPDYLQLAQLSWALWRCYACLLVLPPSY